MGGNAVTKTMKKTISQPPGFSLQDFVIGASQAKKAWLYKAPRMMIVQPSMTAPTARTFWRGVKRVHVLMVCSPRRTTFCHVRAGKERWSAGDVDWAREARRKRALERRRLLVEKDGLWEDHDGERRFGEDGDRGESGDRARAARAASRW